MAGSLEYTFGHQGQSPGVGSVSLSGGSTLQFGAHADAFSSARCAVGPAARPCVMRSAVFNTDMLSMTVIRIQNSQAGQCWRSMTCQVCSAASRAAPRATVNQPEALLRKLVA